MVRWKDRLGIFTTHIQDAMRQQLKGQRHQVHALGSQLHQLSPLGVLGRGYSIVQRERDQKILKEASEVSPGEMIRILLHRGRLACRVDEVKRS